jgi:hypothetical protein
MPKIKNKKRVILQNKELDVECVFKSDISKKKKKRKRK